ncbi:MAG: hypothetical protein ONB44_23280 [candidate division KSB1 bacterium]|nr:hypothetical protein [candidate division KSB1 bacterium]MDZ7313565.1 hypothetical protein [candidate division KSB1 bacterium]
MKPIFTIHAGEYLVAEYIERTYPRWEVWVPSKDAGVDLLVTSKKKRGMVALQVKFSKDFTPNSTSPLVQSHFVACGWWTHDPNKIEKSRADFWIFVLPSFVEKKTNFIILRPTELLRRLRAIHGHSNKLIQSYFNITRKWRCWETRGLNSADRELVALDRFKDKKRDFTAFLNAWDQIEKELR